MDWKYLLYDPIMIAHFIWYHTINVMLYTPWKKLQTLLLSVGGLYLSNFQYLSTSDIIYNPLYNHLQLVGPKIQSRQGKAMDLQRRSFRYSPSAVVQYFSREIILISESTVWEYFMRDFFYDEGL